MWLASLVLVYRWSRVMSLAGNTDSDWHQLRNTECLSNCFQNSGLLIRTTANYCTTKRLCPAMWLAAEHNNSNPYWSSAPSIVEKGRHWLLLGAWISHLEPQWSFCAVLSCTVVGCFLVNLSAIGRTVHELKWQRPLLTGDTPLCHAVSRWMTTIGSRDVLYHVQRLARFTCSLVTQSGHAHYHSSLTCFKIRRMSVLKQENPLDINIQWVYLL